MPYNQKQLWFQLDLLLQWPIIPYCDSVDYWSGHCTNSTYVSYIVKIHSYVLYQKFSICFSMTTWSPRCKKKGRKRLWKQVIAHSFYGSRRWSKKTGWRLLLLLLLTTTTLHRSHPLWPRPPHRSGSSSNTRRGINVAAFHNAMVAAVCKIRKCQEA